MSDENKEPLTWEEILDLPCASFWSIRDYLQKALIEYAESPFDFCSKQTAGVVYEWREDLMIALVKGGAIKGSVGETPEGAALENQPDSQDFKQIITDLIKYCFSKK